jgi:hypothetical protein
MKITWEDGYEKQYQVGASLHGLKHDHLRPVSVTFYRKELKAILSEEGQRWVRMCLFPCLKDT